MDALERLTASQLDRAAEGFQYFELGNAAMFLADAGRRWRSASGDGDQVDALEYELDQGYSAAVPSDSVLV